MTEETYRPLSFSGTVRLLLRATRARAVGRRKRQQELLQQRSRSGTDWSGVGFGFAVLFMAFLNGGAAFIVQAAVESGQRVAVEHRGKIVVSQWFLDKVKAAAASSQTSNGFVWDQQRNTVINCAYVDEVNFPEAPSLCASSASKPPDLAVDPTDYTMEAGNISEKYGGTKVAVEQKLRDAVRNHGVQDFITKDEAAPGITALSKTGALPAMLGSIVLFWWAAMLIFQGEGLELDIQRRRHPMWEWLLSHPVQPGAVFMAEMLSPIAANPIYWSGPLFAGFLYGFVYDPGLGFLAALLIGIPTTIAAACLGKALEIGVILRFPPRSRGAMIGLMGWVGYASMMLFFVGAFVIPKIIPAMAGFLDFPAALPWPWLRWFVGGQADGSFSFLSGMLACWAVAGITMASSVWFSVWATERGLAGNFEQADSGPSVSGQQGTRFGKDPLYRKEFLWFIRDRSAIVQVILIPLTVAGIQVFNLRGLLSHAEGSWNYLCGAGILFGTYFLWILGPKSLSSEGTALWIALTWPRGLESLLKAKAWLWSLISSVMVALVLCYAGYLFPGNIWKIALVGIGWFVFSRSMAEKTVTLVSVTSSSGEREQIPWTRRGAAQLGMLTFCIGVLTQQWHIAIMGIVYSYLTAAAMWQNFRAHLPYLYDPWSEKLPDPPTLMHAMIAISILVEGGAVLTGFVIVLAGQDSVGVAQAISYGICAVIVSLGTQMFLSGRGVLPRKVWRWGEAAQTAPPWWRLDAVRSGKFLSLVLLGAAGGIGLGLFAHGYLALLQHIPATAEIIRKAQEQMAKIPDLKIFYAVMAVAFAPFAEEYLFRGLLYRALDREWGGWRAVVGSAAFFAIYHPTLAWPPVMMLGMANAFLFKKTGRLIPAVILHMVYNAVVLS